MQVMFSVRNSNTIGVKVYRGFQKQLCTIATHVSLIDPQNKPRPNNKTNLPHHRKQHNNQPPPSTDSTHKNTVHNREQIQPARPIQQGTYTSTHTTPTHTTSGANTKYTTKGTSHTATENIQYTTTGTRSTQPENRQHTHDSDLMHNDRTAYPIYNSDVTDV